MPLLETIPRHTDQARELRALIAQRAARVSDVPCESRTCQSLAVASGKGGVGKSVIALNLAAALARRGDSVCLIDASPSIGHLELLCGRTGYWNLSHVAAGSRCLDDVVLNGPNGVRIVSGATCLLGETDSHAGLLRELTDLEREHDWLIIDTAGGDPRRTSPFAHSADRVLIVTTPEPTSIAEAYAVLKGLSVTEGPLASALVNRADSEQQALQILGRLRHAARSFLRTDLDRAGFVPNDPAVWQSVSARRPLIDVEPNCPALLAFERLAERMATTVTTQNQSAYFQRLMQPTRWDHALR
jgi:flagellar biosynthesis protein FlhG